jgi:hypothetical protein
VLAAVHMPTPMVQLDSGLRTTWLRSMTSASIFCHSLVKDKGIAGCV